MEPPTLSWHERPLAELLRLTGPMALSMLSYSFMTLFDVWLVGRLGADQLAGVGLGGTYAYLLGCFGFGFARGAKTLVSQAFGAGRKNEAGAYLGAALLSSFGFGLAAVLLQWPIGAVVARSAASPAQAHFFVTYLLIRSLGTPSASITAALREVRWGLGDASTPTIATLIANAVNMLLGWLFVFHLQWGVAGAAWATVIAQTLEAAILAVAQHRFGWGILAMRRLHLVSLYHQGLPTALQGLLEIGAFAVVASMVAAMGAAQMAAHQITLQLVAFSFLPAYAVGESVSVMVGQAVGALRDDLVPRLSRLAVQVVSTYTGVCTIVLLSTARPLAGAFTNDAIVRDATVRLVHLAGIFLVVDGINITARATLRGVGDVVVPTRYGVALSWGCTPPLVWLFGYHFHMGAFGGWLGMSVEVFALAVVLWLRIRRGDWRPYAARTRAEMLAAASGSALATVA